MKKSFVRITIVTLILISVFSVFSLSVSAQEPTIEVRYNADVTQPPARWVFSELSEVRRHTVDGLEWVEIAHPTWSNVFVLALEWDPLRGVMASQQRGDGAAATRVPDIDQSADSCALNGHWRGDIQSPTAYTNNMGEWVVLDAKVGQQDIGYAYLVAPGFTADVSQNGVVSIYTVGNEDELCLSLWAQALRTKHTPGFTLVN